MYAKDLMPEYGLQFFQLQRRGCAEHALAVKEAVCDQDVAMGVEAEQTAEGLDGDDCAGKGRPPQPPPLEAHGLLRQASRPDVAPEWRDP